MSNLRIGGAQRQDYLNKIQESDRLERIICLSGIRRSGKTTILYQYIDLLLKTKKPEEIVYAKIDDLIGKIDSVHDILNTYHELLTHPENQHTSCLMRYMS
jgi:predicted AAA+ superfamily ATPase